MAGLGVVADRAGAYAATTTGATRRAFTITNKALSKTVRGLEWYGSSPLNPYYYINKVDDLVGKLGIRGFRLGDTRNPVWGAVRYSLMENGFEEVVVPSLVQKLPGG